MPRPQINYATYITAVPTHVLPPHAEASVPIRHYVRSANEAWNLLLYMERNAGAANVYAASFERHMQNLRVMVLLSIVEAFERLLKETAAACIDQIASIILDDRLEVFAARGNTLAWHFTNSGSLGAALCEAVTWCDCDDANRRFRRILADPFDDGKFYVFPRGSQQPTAHRRSTTDVALCEEMSSIWPGTPD